MWLAGWSNRAVTDWLGLVGLLFVALLILPTIFLLIRAFVSYLESHAFGMDCAQTVGFRPEPNWPEFSGSSKAQRIHAP